jgi:uncharacterized protein
MLEAVSLDEGDVQGALVRPNRPNGLGVLVLTGSSGRVDVDLAKRFAALGATALALRWWGGRGQPPGINLVPIETLVRGVDALQAEGCDRIAVHGTSFGALAAALLAVHDPRVGWVVAVSPASVVWQNSGPGIDNSEWPPRSTFTWAGEPLPFVVFDPRAWPPHGSPRPSYRALHEASLRTFAEDALAAAIPVERSQARFILIAGAADALWPSDDAAGAIASRLEGHGRRVVLVQHPHAGHSPVYPGEEAPAEPAERAWGGTPEADRALGAAAWAAIIEHLELDVPSRSV